MAGYAWDYSMSNNAIDAYESGEKPLSKWTKRGILARIKQLIEDGELTIQFDFELLKQLPVKALKELVLERSSWHHTSSWYNMTDFYDVCIWRLKMYTDNVIRKELEAPLKETPKEEKWLCKFLEWSGSRRHPKATEHTEEGVIKGNWFYRANGSKKSITANGFQKIKKVDN